jgi:seryl-tRNA synthetase
LCHEVREIEGTVKALVEKLQEAQNAHNSLTDNLRNIEEDLAVKVNMNSDNKLGSIVKSNVQSLKRSVVYIVQWGE